MSFQDNFEAISGKVTEAAQVAAQKAKDLAMIARAKMQILSEEDKIKKAEVEIGKLSYRDFSAGAEPERGEYLPWYEKITESRAAIDELKLEIEAIKNSGAVTDDDIPDVTEDDFADADFADIEVEVGPDADEEKSADETPAE
ncbi:MAG: hypothetical protein ACI4XG_15620 [Bradyrhizobium sp.]